MRTQKVSVDRPTPEARAVKALLNEAGAHVHTALDLLQTVGRVLNLKKASTK
jgi:hypothetical protein